LDDLISGMIVSSGFHVKPYQANPRIVTGNLVHQYSPAIILNA